MNRAIVLSIVGILVLSSAANADFHMEVTTDRLTYNLGDTINWTLWAWADTEGSGAGVAFVAGGLTDSTGEQMNLPDMDVYGLLASSEYNNPVSGFMLKSCGVTAPGMLVDIIVMQTHITANIGNDGQPHIFATGSYTMATPGAHYLEPIFTAANYWESPSGRPILPFTLGTLTGTSWELLFDPDPGDSNGDSLVNGADLALWQINYDALGTNPYNSWYWGDWNDDDIIDGADLALWQQNYDPIGTGMSTIPEPATIMLLGTGLLADGGCIRRRKG